MDESRIEVIAYAGRRDAETPRAFFLNNERIEVTRITDMWIEEGVHDRIRKRCFKVLGSDGFQHSIYLNEETKEWFIRKA
ncbi:MAG: hypothetical protein AB1552_12940 [Nitrospirota bacterium]